ncbi:transporter [Aureimonas endophytica]|uniref:Transporter n=1 Tax=Aureimonas endophytica TaxID=2027858 RepID=A0A916ZBY6_9HYPH|nr:TolC family outer membrane protein [Aureimonas endophytica]GGD87055.1 transporter [Aureimonas endophytica]
MKDLPEHGTLRLRNLVRFLAAVSVLSLSTAADAETLSGALSRAYRNNQALNIARAQLRATDEYVPQAKSGLRPFVSGTGAATSALARTTNGDNLRSERQNTNQFSGGIELNQTIFDGFQTPNNIRSAEAQVKAAQQNLANTEQNTLSDVVSAYMNVLRDRQIAALRRQNLAFLEEQVRAAQARFDVGEGTRTDVAQAESQRALSTALLNSALSQVASSEATYFQLVGDAPRDLQPGRSIGATILPRTVLDATNISQREHPAILATLFAVDAAAYQVKSAEGRLLPQLSLTARAQDTYATSSSDPNTTVSTLANGLPGVRQLDTLTSNTVQGTVAAQLTIPIYQGGLRASEIRQAKETLGQRQIEVDQTRDQVRAAVASAWAARQAALANVTGYDAQVRAARLALNGVIEERNVGQRTTLDVLNAQADVITAQILLAGAQRDEVVTSYTLASAIGRLSAARLKLDAKIYDPNEHYKAVKNKWGGTRTPDGR